ncbi:hypothetical protein L3V82_08405 [Thiotrichales bacterium 19S3-7]|nr:hypothetical protein [Thiotrichales bacterium 19S3-7]MCF6802129.1 hypothetical protein [Thiotrichales bacterium 19S3-11]
MVTKLLACLFSLGIIFMTSACSSLLPRSKEVTISKWQDFDQLQVAYDKIIPYKTTTEDLEKLGFSPYTANNIRIVNFLDVHKEFDPLMTFNNLPLEVANCIKQENNCVGYYIDIEQLNSKRVGNAFLDVFNFKRITYTTGWDFNAKLILLNNLVIFKTISSLPAIEKLKTQVNPLGPLQNGVNFGIGIQYNLNVNN